MDFLNLFLLFMLVSNWWTISQGFGELWPTQFNHQNSQYDPNCLVFDNSGAQKKYDYHNNKKGTQGMNEFKVITQNKNNPNEDIKVKHNGKNGNENLPYDLPHDSKENIYIFLNKGHTHYMPLNANEPTRVSHFPINVNGEDVNLPDNHVLQKAGILNNVLNHNEFQHKSSQGYDTQSNVYNNPRKEFVAQSYNINHQANHLENNHKNNILSSRKKGCKTPPLKQSRNGEKSEDINKKNVYNNEFIIKNTAIAHQNNYHIEYKHPNTLVKDVIQQKNYDEEVGSTRNNNFENENIDPILGSSHIQDNSHGVSNEIQQENLDNKFPVKKENETQSIQNNGFAHEETTTSSNLGNSNGRNNLNIQQEFDETKHENSDTIENLTSTGKPLLPNNTTTPQEDSTTTESDVTTKAFGINLQEDVSTENITNTTPNASSDMDSNSDLEPSEDRLYSYVTKFDKKSGKQKPQKYKFTFGKLQGKYLDPLAYEAMQMEPYLSTVKMNLNSNEIPSAKPKRYAPMRAVYSDPAVSQRLQNSDSNPTDKSYGKKLYFPNDKLDFSTASKHSQRRSPLVGKNRLQTDDNNFCLDNNQNQKNLVGSPQPNGLKKWFDIFRNVPTQRDAPLVGNNIFSFHKNDVCVDDNGNEKILGSSRQNGNGKKISNNSDGPHPFGIDNGRISNDTPNGAQIKANDDNCDDDDDDDKDGHDKIFEILGDSNRFKDRVGNVTPARPETFSQIC